MDKRAINNFAVKARRDLIRDITNKLGLLGIDEDGIQEKRAESTAEIEYYGELAYEISGDDIRLRRELVSHLKSRVAEDWNTLLQDFIEEVAYTWFNRIIAIRFMEVNDYLPSKTRVLSSENGRTEPDILTEAFDIEDDLRGFNSNQRALLAKALDTEIPEDLDKAYTMLFIKQANALNDNLPYLFERTSDYMQLLFTPSYHDGVIKDLIDGIPESDFDVQLEGQVEIIGWLYQYYNEEPHNAVVNINGGTVKTNDIPAATQLFTTDWVVRYMVDNSLGKYYLERNAHSELGTHLEFLLPDSLEMVSDDLDVTQIKVIDNAMGSGHILVYAFDVLMKMYAEQGYSSREASSLILENNLFGLEIDKRAYQLAYFALMMKAREYNRRALTSNISPKVYVFEDTSNINDNYFESLPVSESNIQDLKYIVSLFHDSRTLGSIIQIDKPVKTGNLRTVLTNIPQDTSLDLNNTREITYQLLRLLDIVETMQNKYEAVITNPPYLNKMNKVLKEYVKTHYKDYSSDLFSVFIWHNINMTVTNGYAAYMTPFVWMFIKSYENLRKSILNTKLISSLIQMEYSAFEEATVPINTFVLKNSSTSENGVYIKLSDFKGGMDVQKVKTLEAIENPDVDYLYRTNQSNFSKIPGSPIAYWASDNLLQDFEIGTRMDELVDPRQGLATADNNRFLRQWFEVSYDKIKFDAKSIPESVSSNKKWFPYNKGGSYRKWYGNYDYVVNWENDGQAIKNFKFPNGKQRSVVRNPNYYFREAITWSAITSGVFSVRLMRSGFVFSNAGMAAFNDNHDTLLLLLSLMNSKVGNYILKSLNPTINLGVGDFSNMPVLFNRFPRNSVILTTNKILIVTVKDWDSFETSWDFTQHPLLSQIDEHNRNWTLKEAFEEWKNEAQDRFDQLKDNEEELNRIFIDLYGLQDELTPDVEDKDVSVRTADEVRDVKSFLSYFVGLVFGRYSLDAPGLIYAGGDWEPGKYKSFQPNKDNVLILTDDSYFNDSRDIINRLKEFLRVTFGDENVQTNLEYIAQVIGKGGNTAEEKIRQYFIKDFYADHVSNYSKRPIYWEYNSGKKEGLRALMYSHRYDADTTGMIRTDYLLPLQEAYENALSNFESLVENETVVKTRKIYEKRVTRLTNQIYEMKIFDQVLQHVATARIEIDLDDGVIENHAKIQDGQKLLTKIK
ncbi:BREX-1 system adenine-specific DNA-methyltransferase PglX [Leuconostoc carnosum]|uniref:BREX-1 system adenine-specific DNA-methyltransferase PglX n=1 Tax=Leuconostoc carnosum TaxID=1252 RepID=UPI0012395C1A|nr:BREX-1 system adenine-specific DNA-methyltransferase PglX [Leuconostoc carnosum]KAA8357667.1 BREX-1 system adenine-specific DNA-methyltransferase PglX [Leuconostoc carnosum]KAA8364383.1 BREX-1 system adenine-specific DNA-methyltransferase PglX [Leuconostoc carnosum]